MDIHLLKVKSMKQSKKEKQDRIHSAMKSLVESRNINTISIYDVACEARMSASTIYNSYPNVEAILYEMLDDILLGFNSVITEVSLNKEITTWQEVNRQLEMGFARYSENNSLILKMIYSQHQYVSVKEKEHLHDIELGERVFELYNNKFYLPMLPEDKNIFTVALQASDKIYHSYHNENGEMTKSNVSEAIILTQSYLGYYLPQYLKLKDS